MIDQRIYTVPSTTNPGAQQPQVKIWHNAGTNALVVNSDANVYPAKSLVVTAVGNLVTVKVISTGAVVAGPMGFDRFADEFGNTFTSATLVVQYLATEFAKDTGSGGGLTYEHTQGVASETWTVVHNFGAYPSQSAVYVGGTLVQASVVNVDLNTILVSFLAPQVGTVSVSL